VGAKIGCNSGARRVGEEDEAIDGNGKGDQAIDL
jgi:hypothetical protein